MSKKSILKFERQFDNIYNTKPPERTVLHQEAIDRVDAILSYLSTKVDVPELTLNPWTCKWFVSLLNTPVRIEEKNQIDLIVTHLDQADKTVKLKFQIESSIVVTSVLKKWTEDLYDKFIETRESCFTGSQLYLFEAKPFERMAKSGAATQLFLEGKHDVNSDITRHNQKAQDIRAAQGKPLEFIKRSFFTNKNFENLFGPSVDRIRSHLTRFQTQEEEYHKRGLPYRFGALISGLPGCGKTSVIQAIAAQTNRHIVTVNFNNLVTVDRLTNLFYSDVINVCDDGKDSMSSVAVRIPLNRRLYVLEDIDALDDIVLQRTETRHGINQNNGLGSIPNEITLSDILNVLDGTLQNSGRIMIVTTNHPEKLDSALIRAGRFDCKCRFELSSPPTIITAFDFFFQHITDSERLRTGREILKSLDSSFSMSMADIHCIFFEHFDDPIEAASTLRKQNAEVNTRTSKKRKHLS